MEYGSLWIYTRQLCPVLDLVTLEGCEAELSCYCVRSPEWKSVPDKVKQDIGMQIKREGEFWSVALCDVVVYMSLFISVFLCGNFFVVHFIL